MSNSNQASSFDPEQEANLRNIARSSAPDANMYAYTEGYHGNQTNGTVYANSDFVNNENSTYTPATSAMQSGQPLDMDAQTLLESLASFEHPSQNNDAPPSTGGDHFASLLQAAATAGGQESQGDYGEMRRSTRHSRQAGFAFPVSPAGNGVASRPSRSQDMQDETFKSNKRRRDEVSEDEDQLAREREIWGPSPPEDETGEPSTIEADYASNPPIGPSDARAAGVHSAAALFRRPSQASKKYTRPPMSKLFTSLELSPEDFLHLQAAAKTYMLDPNHPERRDCVGNRGRGDTDMVKLKLFGCVKNFLEDEGWGDRCFSSDDRKLKWPQMKNKVISLVTPLLRRMVTNERQRQYAVEARKSGNPKKRGQDDASETSPPNTQSPYSPNNETQNSNIDPKLDPYHYNIDPTFSNAQSQSPTKRFKSAETLIMETHPATVAQSEAAQAVTIPNGIDNHFKYHINILHNNTCVRSPAAVSASNCPGFSSLVQHAHNIIGDAEGLELKRIRVLSMSGLVEVEDDEKWAEIIQEFSANNWLGSDLRIVVEIA